jgi:hypothetical protein
MNDGEFNNEHSMDEWFDYWYGDRLYNIKVDDVAFDYIASNNQE